MREVQQLSIRKLSSVIFRNVVNLSEAPVKDRKCDDTFDKIWTQSNFSDDSIGDFV